VFVAKLNPTGTQLSFRDVSGGSLARRHRYRARPGREYLRRRSTLSRDFPTTPGAFQTTHKGTNSDSNHPVKLGDAFITKLSADGSRLIYSTLLGGSRDDTISSLALDSTAPSTSRASRRLPISHHGGAYSRTYKGQPACAPQLLPRRRRLAAKLNPAGSQLVYSSCRRQSMTTAAGPYSWIRPAPPTLRVHRLVRFPVTSDALQRTAKPNWAHGFFLKLDANGGHDPDSTFFGGTK